MLRVKKTICSRNQTTESSYKVAECIANRGKPFTDGNFIKEVFINCSEVLFEDLPNKSVILSRIKNLPVSARTVEVMPADVPSKYFSSSQRWQKAVFQQQKCWQDDGVQSWPRVGCTKITFSANIDKLRFASV